MISVLVWVSMFDRVLLVECFESESCRIEVPFYFLFLFWNLVLVYIKSEKLSGIVLNSKIVVNYTFW